MRRRPLAVVLCCLCMVVPAAAAGIAGTGAASAAPDDPNPCVGTMTEPADGITVVSVQGMRFGDDGGKRQARLVALGPRGNVEWVHQRDDTVWSYDVDPEPDGTLFVTATTQIDDGDDQGETLFYKLDPETGEVVWEETADFLDTHDADLLDDERILVANMRANQGVDGNRDRLLVYNRTTDEITWQWQFRDHFDDRGIGGNYSEDWTHVNDVDAVNDTHYLASPRNFDMTILVNRTSGDVEWTVGEPNSGEKMLKQHNPVHYESENGTSTVLVADSENDRVVEFARRGGEWEQTWRVGNASSMSWPRDADRLPDGNTLVGDSRNNRVLEVTPSGEVVWEVYTPWLVYDVERVQYGDEAGGPTIADQNATGAVDLHGDERWTANESEACAAHLDDATRLSELGGNDGGDGGGVIGDIFGGGGDGGDGGDGGGGGDGSSDIGDVGGVVGNEDGGVDPLRVVVALAAVGVVGAGAAVAYRRRSGGG